MDDEDLEHQEIEELETVEEVDELGDQIGSVEFELDDGEFFLIFC